MLIKDSQDSVSIEQIFRYHIKKSTSKSSHRDTKICSMFHKVYVSLRKSSEWGMRALQDTFCANTAQYYENVDDSSCGDED